jgi:hypothetical protein
MNASETMIEIAKKVLPLEDVLECDIFVSYFPHIEKFSLCVHPIKWSKTSVGKFFDFYTNEEDTEGLFKNLLDGICKYVTDSKCEEGSVKIARIAELEKELSQLKGE